MNGMAWQPSEIEYFGLAVYDVVLRNVYARLHATAIFSPTPLNIVDLKLYLKNIGGMQILYGQPS